MLHNAVSSEGVMATTDERDDILRRLVVQGDDAKNGAAKTKAGIGKLDDDIIALRDGVHIGY